jgi:hypothetical protein
MIKEIDQTDVFDVRCGQTGSTFCFLELSIC